MVHWWEWQCVEDVTPAGSWSSCSKTCPRVLGLKQCLWTNTPLNSHPMLSWGTKAASFPAHCQQEPATSRFCRSYLALAGVFTILVNFTLFYNRISKKWRGCAVFIDLSVCIICKDPIKAVFYPWPVAAAFVLHTFSGNGTLQTF